MKRLKNAGARNGGFTIVETLIVLSTTALLALLVMNMIAGQQGRAEFTQAVRDADSRIKDMINDYATGFYERTGNVKCSADGSGNPPILSSSASDLGVNIGCIYAGRIMKFSNTNTFTLHTMAGRQYDGPVFSQEVSTLLGAQPRLIHPTPADPSLPNLAQVGTFDGGVTIGKVIYVNSTNAERETGAFGVISNFGTTTGTSLRTDKQSPLLMAFTTHTMAHTDTQLAGKVSTLTTSDFVTNRPVAICFLSGKSKQHAVIRIGDNQGRLTTSTIIGSGDTCPADLVP